MAENLIGKNIKNLRINKNITQERLAERLSVSTQAVSKWERGESLPDISMVIPLAAFFGVSTDEILGFKAAEIENKICDIITEIRKARIEVNSKRVNKLILKAYEEFPNDFRIMNLYMWEIVGDFAENDNTVLSKSSEIEMICNRILNECTDDTIRRSAINMQAKLLKSRGDYENALKMLDRFPEWFGETKGQKAEQLFEKNSSPWWFWLNHNIVSLSIYLTDKVYKSIRYSEKCFEEKIKAQNKVIDILRVVINSSGYKPIYMLLAQQYGNLAGLSFSNDRFDETIDALEKMMECSVKFEDYINSDEQVNNTNDEFKRDLYEMTLSDSCNMNPEFHKLGFIKRGLRIMKYHKYYDILKNNSRYKDIIKKYEMFVNN